MGRLEFTRAIAAPPERVFAFFVPQRMPYWYGREMDSCFQVQNAASDFRAGLSVRIAGRLGKETVGHTVVVIEYERPRVLEWRFTDAYGVTGAERWELQRLAGPDAKHDAKDADRTLVKFVNRYQLPGRFGPVVDWLITRHALRRRYRDYLERLAKLVEPRAVRV